MDHSLAVFVRVAERENFSRAAEDLHLTQPAVSLQIKALEKDYGAVLFERGKRQVRLTPAGDILLVHAREVLRQEKEARRLIEDLVAIPRGPLSIGASYTVGEYVLPRLLSPFLSRHPDIVPSISIANTQRVVEGLKAHQIEVAIVEGEVQADGLDVSPFVRDQLVVIVPRHHRLAGEPSVPATDLEKDVWLLREPGSGTREATERLFRETGISPGRTVQLGSTQAIKESVEVGLGVSLISRWAIRKEMALATLSPLLVQGNSMDRLLFVVVERVQFRSRALQVFLQFLAERARTAVGDDSTAGW